VSLPNSEVLDLLRTSFVVGWTNIQKESHVGMSHGYRCDQTAVGTTNGAGGRNVQLVALAADGRVLHVLPGFWHPDDLVRELRFARDLNRLWLDDRMDVAGKQRMAAAMRQAHVRSLPPATVARSTWQGFDESEEIDRYRKSPRDTVELDADGVPHVLPICRLVHERMASRTFVRFDDFDMESFVDYGRPYYDNNSWLDRGRAFTAAERQNAQREQALAKQEALITGKGKRRG